MAITGAHLIGGRWQRTEPVFVAVNPQTGQALAPAFGQAAQREVDAALAAAVSAFQAVRGMDPRWPAQLLDSVAEQIMNLGDELLDRGTAETALPKNRLISERGRTVGQLRMFADIVREGAWLDATIDTADPARQPLPKPDLRRMLIPRGPVAVFGASNFPFAFGAVGGDSASAIAAGNPVIVKGHPSHPGTSELFAAAVAAALQSLDLPAGLFALLQGTSHELSGQLIEHPATSAVGFTGSRKAGRALFDLAAHRPRPIPVYAEMGSVNPLIILPGALRQRGQSIAKDLANSVLLGGGQFCTKPGLILTLGDAEKFLADLGAAMAATASVTMLNQPLRDALVARTTQWSQIPGVIARLLCKPLNYAATSPALLETLPQVFLRNESLHEEAFGPAALVVRCAREQEIVEVLEKIGGSLTGAIHADAGDQPAELLGRLEAIVGRIVLNGYPTGVEVCRAMVHGGPYPATTDPASTSVGSAAIARFARMIAFQNTPDALLPPALKNANPLKIARTVNGKRTTDAVG